MDYIYYDQGQCDCISIKPDYLTATYLLDGKEG